MKKSHFIIIGSILGVIILANLLNKWVSHQVDSIVDKRLAEQEMLKKIQEEKDKQTAYRREIEALKQKKVAIEKVVMDPNREYEVHIVSLDKKEMGRYKTDNKGNMFDVEGEIPNGMVRFFNDFKKTYGEANYQDNRLHGFVTEYYENGQLKREAKYIKGVIKTDKEYFIDGLVRMEADYEDALRFVENKKLELGVGKVYFRDGKVMYEWHITNSDKKGYNRSYDTDGTLVEENIFDEYGNLVEKWDFRKMKKN